MFIALREIRRSKGRFALLTGAVALLVLLLMFFQAVAGTLTLGLTGAVDRNESDIWVYAERARNNPYASVIQPDVAGRVADVDGVSDAGPIGIAVLPALRTTGSDEVEVTVFGGDTSGVAAPATLSDGRRLDAAGEAIFSGSSLDESFDIGDSVTIGGETITVVGVASDAALNVQPTFYVAFDTYRRAVANRSGIEAETVPASVIGVAIADGAAADDVVGRIDGAELGLSALTRRDAVAALPGVGTVSQSFSILYVLLYIVVTIVTGVFFLILTVQKAASLVLLRAVGASQRDVVRPVLIEVLFVVGAGAVVGASVAAGLLYLTRDTFGANLNVTTIGVSVAAVCVLGLIASVGAVRRVLKIDPVAASGGMEE